MNKNELIVKQQLKIEEYEEMLRKNSEVKNDLMDYFYAMGQPLNDNVLGFNRDQKRWCFNVVELVKELEVINQDLPF